jgi:hypothetical protein
MSAPTYQKPIPTWKRRSMQAAAAMLDARRYLTGL